jgi:hypothetical protein
MCNIYYIVGCNSFLQHVHLCLIKLSDLFGSQFWKIIFFLQFIGELTHDATKIKIISSHHSDGALKSFVETENFLAFLQLINAPI